MKSINFIAIAIVFVLTAFQISTPQKSDQGVTNDIELSSADPLPSWNEGNAKQSIINFVQAVTKDGGSDYVKPSDRIATFDNDGTLWSEQPYYFQLQFALDQVKRLAPQHPEWKNNPLLNAAINNDIAKVISFGEHGLLELVMTTHSGMTTDEFTQTVNN